MAWSIIRKANNTEIETLNAKAVAFAERHDVGYGSVEDACGLNLEISADVRSGNYEVEEKNVRLRKLWRAIVRRTLGDGAEGIVGGYVGYHVA